MSLGCPCLSGVGLQVTDHGCRPHVLGSLHHAATGLYVLVIELLQNLRGSTNQLPNCIGYHDMVHVGERVGETESLNHFNSTSVALTQISNSIQVTGPCNNQTTEKPRPRVKIIDTPEGCTHEGLEVQEPLAPHNDRKRCPPNAMLSHWGPASWPPGAWPWPLAFAP